MYTFLLILLVIDAIILGAAVLMQAGKGGGLAASFGGAGTSTESFLGMRQAGNLLTRLSWWCGGIFLGLAFILSLMSISERTPRSILDEEFAPAVPSSADLPPAGAPAPALPLEPAPAAPEGQTAPQP